MRFRPLAVCIAGGALVAAATSAVGATVTEVAKLVASDGAADDWFGESVSVSGDTAIVGAEGDDDNGDYSGSAYVLDRNAGGAGNWGQVVKLTASDGAAGDYFGYSVSVSGDTVVVGASLDDDKGDYSGSAYVFQRDEGGLDNWGEVAKLLASDGAAGEWFGLSVCVSGDTAVVGTPGDNDNGFESGSAYVFDRNLGGPDAWDQVNKLTASDGAAGDYFGYSVSVSGDTVVVGAYGGGANGSAYVFYRDQGGADAWGQVKKLTASDGAADDWFGCSVSVSGDTVVVGAYGDGANGSAYVFVRDEGGLHNWGEVKKLLASDGAAGAQFGRSVSAGGDTAVVGAFRDDDKGNASGSAYVFQRDEGGLDNWGEVAKLLASDGAADDYFGCSVSVSGDTVVIGADHDDEGSEIDCGSAYIFERTVTPFGGGCGENGCGASAALAFCVLTACLALRRRERLRE